MDEVDDKAAERYWESCPWDAFSNVLGRSSSRILSVMVTERDEAICAICRRVSERMKRKVEDEAL